MIRKAILQAFGIQRYKAILPLSSGLIHNTYKVEVNVQDGYVVQQMNINVFKDPYALQHNYAFIRAHLSAKEVYNLPHIVTTVDGDVVYKEGEEVWRCFPFLQHTYSKETAATPKEAWQVATTFGRFGAGLGDINMSEIKVIIPRFHDLSFRYAQFQTAFAAASDEAKTIAADVIAQADQYQYLLQWFQTIVKEKETYPVRIMHHDCKIANILFDNKTQKPLCPVDLDTTQQGYFFSDVGDMVRSMISASAEGAPADSITIRPHFYEAILDGYFTSMGSALTEKERTGLSFAGPVLLYMQALRFLTDFLSGNIYYQVTYPLQNKDRATHQFKLLQLLENHLKRT